MELLVVIALILLLAALLLPSLKEVRERSRRAVCLSNLRQWAIAITGYAGDNSGALLQIPVFNGGRWPDIASITACSQGWLDPQPTCGVFSIAAMRGYVSGIDDARRTVRGIWRCPSAIDFARKIDTDNSATWTVYNYVDFNYTPFGRTELIGAGEAFQPQPAPVAATELCQRDLVADRLLITDNCFFWAGTGQWQYNHGKNGASYHFGGESGVPSITGVNQAYGDGHARWKPVTEFNPVAMSTLSAGPGSHFFGQGGNAGFFW